MKVLSWNIWIDCHFDLLKDFLKAADADIIGLQEVKDDDPKRDVIGFLTGLGYQHIFARTEKEWEGKVYRHGPAIFSKLPIVHSETYFLDDKDQYVAVRADVEVNGKVLHIFSTHLVHTHQKPSTQQETQVAQLIEKLPADRVVVVGDFNASPQSTAIQEMNKVLTDTDPSASPTWSMHPEGCLTCNPQVVDIRLDYIFVSRDLKASSFLVGKSVASDHLPITIDLEI